MLAKETKDHAIVYTHLGERIVISSSKSAFREIEAHLAVHP
jgi:hypothetical protein